MKCFAATRMTSLDCSRPFNCRPVLSTTSADIPRYDLLMINIKYDTFGISALYRCAHLKGFSHFLSTAPPAPPKHYSVHSIKQTNRQYNIVKQTVRQCNYESLTSVFPALQDNQRIHRCTVSSVEVLVKFLTHKISQNFV